MADFGHGRRVLASQDEVWLQGDRALDKEAHGLILGEAVYGCLVRVGHGERRNGELALGPHSKPGPAGDQSLQEGAGREAFRHYGACIHDLFEVVENQEHPALAQEVLQRLQHTLARNILQPHSLCDRRRHLRWIGDAGKPHEVHALEVVQHFCRDVDGQASLADPTGAGEGH